MIFHYGTSLQHSTAVVGWSLRPAIGANSKPGNAKIDPRWALNFRNNDKVTDSLN